MSDTKRPDMTNAEAAKRLTRRAEQALGAVHGDGGDLASGEAWLDYLALDKAIAALAAPGWIRTADRLPEGDEHDETLGLYKGPEYLLYDIVQIGWMQLHPEMYPYWTHLPQKPEVTP